MRGTVLFGMAVVLVGCGPIESGPTQQARGQSAVDTVASGDGQGFVIVVSPDSEVARMVGSELPANRFVARQDVVLAPGASSLWQMSTEPATDDEAAVLADVLGIDGGVRAGDPGFGMTHVAGSLDDGVGQLSVFDFAEPTWSLQPSQNAIAQSGAGGSSNAASGPDVDAAVGGVMAVLGVETGDFSVESSSGRQLVEARIEFTPDGLRTDVVWNLTIASDGAILGGDGPVRVPQVVGDVPTVGLDEALLRLSRVIPAGPVLAVPVDPMQPPTTSVAASPTSLVDNNANSVVTAPPPTVPAQPLVLPTITAVEPALVSVWDISNRKWLVPAIIVASDDGFTTTIPTISSDHLRLAELSEVDAPVRTGPPLTIPVAPTPIGPATTMLLPSPTTTAVPQQPDNAPPPTTTLPSSGPTLPRPTLPVPSPTLLASDGTPMTLPIPPDPNEMNADQIPEWYEQALNAVLVGRPLDEALDTLQRTGWTVRTDDLDDANETFDADLRIGRATVQHRNRIVVSITVG